MRICVKGFKTKFADFVKEYMLILRIGIFVFLINT